MLILWKVIYALEWYLSSVCFKRNITPKFMSITNSTHYKWEVIPCGLIETMLLILNNPNQEFLATACLNVQEFLLFLDFLKCVYPRRKCLLFFVYFAFHVTNKITWIWLGVEENVRLKKKKKSLMIAMTVVCLHSRRLAASGRCLRLLLCFRYNCKKKIVFLGVCALKKMTLSISNDMETFIPTQWSKTLLATLINESVLPLLVAKSYL